MYRVSLAFEQQTAEGIAFPPLALWVVKKCRKVADSVLPYTAPIRIETEHGRKLLQVLSPVPITRRTFHTPYEIVRAYLHELPVETKLAREVGMRLLG